LAFVITDDGREIRQILTSPGPALTFLMKKQLTRTCTLATSRGAFGYTVEGTILQPTPTPIVAVGRVEYDREGRGVGAEHVNVGGMLLPRTVEVVTEVGRDCTGSGSLVDNLGQEATFAFVLVDGQNEAFLLGTDPTAVLWVHGVRQFPRGRGNRGSR
jgi:hypothetical protein